MTTLVKVTNVNEGSKDVEVVVICGVSTANQSFFIKAGNSIEMHIHSNQSLAIFEMENTDVR